jgi:competence protein ComEA
VSEGERWIPPRDPGPAVLTEVPDLAPLVRAALAKRLPPAVRGARLRLSWPAVTALAVVVAVAVAGGGLLVLHGRPSRVAADEPLPATGGFVPRSPGPTATSSTASVVVEIAGRVRKPGVVTLPVGSRVVDALRAAGGVLPGTDTTSLGLARKLVDGEQVRVGLPGLPPRAGAATSNGPLDLNTATTAQLDALPGVGPVLAGRIVAWRDAHGGFASVGQLKEVEGLSGKRYDTLSALVTVP